MRLLCQTLENRNSTKMTDKAFKICIYMKRGLISKFMTENSTEKYHTNSMCSIYIYIYIYNVINENHRYAVWQYEGIKYRVNTIDYRQKSNKKSIPMQTANYISKIVKKCMLHYYKIVGVTNCNFQFTNSKCNI